MPVTQKGQVANKVDLNEICIKVQTKKEKYSLYHIQQMSNGENQGGKAEEKQCKFVRKQSWIIHL